MECRAETTNKASPRASCLEESRKTCRVKTLQRNVLCFLYDIKALKGKSDEQLFLTNRLQEMLTALVENSSYCDTEQVAEEFCHELKMFVRDIQKI